MPTFICSLSWTDKGIRSIEEALKRRGQMKFLATSLHIKIKDIYLTSGDSDVLVIMDAPDGESVAKFALVVGSRGNVRTRTARAYTESESVVLLNAAVGLQKQIP